MEPEVSNAIMKYGLAGGGHFVGSDELQSYWPEAVRAMHNDSAMPVMPKYLSNLRAQLCCSMTTPEGAKREARHAKRRIQSLP